MNRVSRRVALLSQVFAGTCLVSPAFAQTSVSAPTSAPTATPPKSAHIEEVIVRAQRRSERLQKVPVAVTAITGRALASHGEEGVIDLTTSVSNLTLIRNGTAVTPFIRGVGSNGSNPNDEQSVALYIDGVYIASPVGNLLSFNNIDQVEVLKGPQGTLFGRNATAGVIQILTKDPSSTPSGQVSVGYGNYNTVTTSAYATGGILPNLAGDIALNFSDNFDGYGHNVTNGQPVMRDEEVALRSKLLWTPSDETSIRLEGNYTRSNSDGTDYQLVPGVIGAAGKAYNTGAFNTNTDWPNYADIMAYGGSLRVKQSFDFADVISTSAYRYVRELYSLDEDSSPAPIVNSLLTGIAQDFSQELQLVSTGAGPLKWQLGAYYFNGRYAYDPFFLGGLAAEGAVGLPAIDTYGQQRTSSGSVYGQATYAITKALHFTAGLRYTSEYQSDRGSIETTTNVPLVNAPFRKQVFDRLTWRFALDYQFTDNLLGYISDNRGMKSGGFNILSPGDNGYYPEILDAYEIGLKSELFDHRIRFNIAGYYYDYHNIQVQSIVSGAVYTVNAAGAQIKGFDMDTTAVIIPGLTVSGGLGYTDGEYSSFPDASFFPASPFDGPATVSSAVGKRVVNAPRWTGNASIDYSFDTSFGSFLLDGSATFRTMSYVTPDNRLQIPSYQLFNASLTWNPLPKYSIQIWGHNLANETYYATRVETSLGDIQYQGPPRTYGFTLTAKF